MFRTMQPEVLDVTLLGGLLLRNDTRSVVSAQFVAASALENDVSVKSFDLYHMHTTRSSPDVFRRAIKRHGLEALRIIGTNGAANNK